MKMRFLTPVVLSAFMAASLAYAAPVTKPAPHSAVPVKAAVAKHEKAVKPKAHPAAKHQKAPKKLHKKSGKKH